MSFDGTEFGREVVAAVRGHLERSVGTMLERLEALERRVAEAAPGPLPPDVLRPMVAEEVGKAVAALPAPAVPPALVGSLIDREGVLVLTLSDGEVRHVGPVVGRDADPAALLAAVKEEVARLPVPENGKDGRDGFGFDDLAVEHDGDRTVTLRFARGTESKAFPLELPVVLDRGVWREGESYAKGDAVTWAGSLWIAQRGTAEKPETGEGWRLAVKRGRDGRDAPRPAGRP
jgi:hypothetical protein